MASRDRYSFKDLTILLGSGVTASIPWMLSGRLPEGTGFAKDFCMPVLSSLGLP